MPENTPYKGESKEDFQRRQNSKNETNNKIINFSRRWAVTHILWM